MVQPAPRIIRAPVKKRAEVVRTSKGGEEARGAARRVENRQGRKR